MPSSSSSLLGYGASTWSSSAWSSSLSSTPSPSPSPLSIPPSPSPSSTTHRHRHTRRQARTPKTRLKHGHYIAKSISRLLSIYSYSHRFDKTDKTNEKRLGMKKKGRGEKTDARRCIKKNKQTNKKRWLSAWLSREKKKRERRKVEGINRGIDGVCVCEGKTSHCRSCD